MFRYYKHKKLGVINLAESRPRTYKLKVLFQVIMSIATLVMAIDTDYADGKYTFEPMALIYVFYSFIWLLSIYL